MKIHILGGPGSGKTTLARAIAAQAQATHYDLDQFGHRFGYDPNTCAAESQRILQQPGWVTEGIYLLFVDLFLAQAEHIVLLDITWPTAARRILWRHLASSLRGTNPYPGLKPLYDLLKYARGYYRGPRLDSAASMRAYLDEYRAEPAPTAQSIIAKMEKYPGLIIPPTAAFVRQYLEPYTGKVVTVRNPAERKRLLGLLGIG